MLGLNLSKFHTVKDVEVEKLYATSCLKEWEERQELGQNNLFFRFLRFGKK